MNKKNINQIFLFAVILFLLIGLVSAAEINNTEAKTSKVVEETSEIATSNQVAAVDKKIANNDTTANIENEKRIEKNNKKTLKTDSSQNIYVSSGGLGSGSSKNNPTNINDALLTITNGGTINLVTSGNTDTYTDDLVISQDNLKAGTTYFNIVGEATKTINFKGNFEINDVKLTLKNINFNGEETSLYNYADSLTVDNCTFTSNSQTYRNSNGGALYNIGKNLKVSNCVFKNNLARFEMDDLLVNFINIVDFELRMRGGALYNSGDYATIVNNTFMNNRAFTVATSYGDRIVSGGALYNYGDYASIKDNYFENNEATDNGGAIYNCGYNTEILNNVFKNNEAATGKGSALFCTGINNIIGNNTFQNNKAGSSFNKLLYVGGSNQTFTKNIIEAPEYTTILEVSDECSETFKSSDNLVYYNNTYNYNISENVERTFTQNNKLINKTLAKTKLTIQLNNRKPYVESTVKVTLKLTDNDSKSIEKQKITLTVGAKKYTLTTNGDGIATVNYKTDKTGTVKLTATYAGVPEHFATSKTTQMTVQPKIKTVTSIKLNNTKPYISSKTKVTVTLKDSTGKAVKSQKVTVKIGSSTYTRKTNSKGEIVINYKTAKTGTFKVTATFNGSTQYVKSAKSVNMKVQPKVATKMTIKLSKTKVKVNDKVTVTLTLKDKKNKVVKSQKISVKIGSSTYTLKTNSKGIATKTFKATKATLGKTITAVYKGDYMYVSSKVSKKLLKA